VTFHIQEVRSGSTRDIARAAIRENLAQVAYELFSRDGFEKVTVNDLASAAGVSRSTFLRYFGNKEEAVLGFIDSRGRLVAENLRTRPASEDDWTALRRALDTAIEPYHQEPDSALAITRLIQETPTLNAWSLKKHHTWRRGLIQALAERDGSAESPTLQHATEAAAALACLNVALEYWTTSDGRLDLDELLDEAFAYLHAGPASHAGRGARS
jgi:AcrR family transcriptional regulator